LQMKAQARVANEPRRLEGNFACLWHATIMLVPT
jgi:hypothetical protein